MWVDEDDPDTTETETHHWKVVESQVAIDAAEAASTAHSRWLEKRGSGSGGNQQPHH